MRRAPSARTLFRKILGEHPPFFETTFRFLEKKVMRRIQKLRQLLELKRRVEQMLPKLGLNLQDLIEVVTVIFPLPDWRAAEDVRQWMIKVLTEIEDVTDDTDTVIDDAIVNAVKLIAANEELWMFAYSLLQRLIADDNEGMMQISVGEPQVVKLADEAEISPAVIVAIITAIMKLIEMWRRR